MLNQGLHTQLLLPLETGNNSSILGLILAFHRDEYWCNLKVGESGKKWAGGEMQLRQQAYSCAI